MNLSFESILYSVVTILIALTVHEYAHGLVATKLGDDTPRLQGRLTLNPIKHLDLFGSLMLILVGFGWAKPVEVNPLRFKGNKKTGMVLVALAGPLSNFLLAVLSGFILKFITSGIIPYNAIFGNFFMFFLQINVVLMVFNLIPLPPLDGWRVLGMFVPSKYYFQLQNISRYSMLIILLLMITGILGMVLNPLVNGVIRFILMITGLN